jgi:hypothetical protein
LKAPELSRSVELQVEAFLDGRKPAVLFMEADADKYLKDYKCHPLEGGDFVYNSEESLDLALSGHLGLALGYGIDFKPKSQVLTAFTREGLVIVDIMTDGRKAVELAAQKIAGDGYIKYRSVNEVVGERRDPA